MKKKKFDQKLQFYFSSDMRKEMDEMCEDREMGYGQLIRWLIRKEAKKNRVNEQGH